MKHDHIVALRCESLGQLDGGRFGRAVDRAMRIIEQDISDRPSNAAGKPERRKLVIELSYLPRVEFDDDSREQRLTGIEVEPRVKGTVPPTVGSVHDTRLRNGTAQFNTEQSGNFDARPLFDESDFDSDVDLTAGDA